MREKGIEVGKIFPNVWVSSVEMDALSHNWNEFKERVDCK
jgi:hypothetical protein